MKIEQVEAIALEIPFSHGGRPAGWGGKAWQKLSVVLVKVTCEGGLVGHGEAFSYNCRRAVQAAVEDMVAPLAVGRDARDIRGLMRQLQQELHLFGRYGITLFALSGLDIALWDLAGKAAGLPLSRLLGGPARASIPAYASLFKYRDPEVVRERCGAALEQGYRWIKLHETEEPEVAAARQALGSGVPLMVDTNCPWTPLEALASARRLRPYDLLWLEEPIFPPEDFAALARLQEQSGVPLAAGENACTAVEFQRMLAAGAVTYVQPSVTKLGGVTELLKVAELAPLYGAVLMPHAPYFGPGFLATLQLLSALPGEGLIERLYVSLEASLYGDLVDPVDGEIRVPDGPGLGREPDPEVVEAYRVDED